MDSSAQSELDALRERLADAPPGARAAMNRKLKFLARREAKGLPIDKGLAKLDADLARLTGQVAGRDAIDLNLAIPPDLPIAERADDIVRAIVENQVVIVAGETGSGKTTQLPKLCRLSGRGNAGWIGMTQPRRIAARSIAARLAEETDTQLGQQIGYQVRFDDQVTADSLIKVMTDGILLAEVQRDRDLARYDTIIIDEAHERSLNIDFLLGILKAILPRRPDLKLIITSATIDTARFSAHFDDAPVIEVSGRGFPVDIQYRPLSNEDDDDGNVMDLNDGIVAAVRDAIRLGDVLVFLPGERDIREAQRALEKCRLGNTEVLPLFARLSAADQRRIFHPGHARRVVLTTNIAETSLTVPRIMAVVDSGLARISRYSSRSKVQRLPIEEISQASANQRAGRCGRLAPGTCFRLYSRENMEARPEFTDPEIVRTNLATVILKMKALKLGRVEEFPFLDAPDDRLVRDGYQLLDELQALDKRQNLTQRGRNLLRWPLDVRLARIMESGMETRNIGDMATIAAALSIQDPRERPLGLAAAADEAHEQWRDQRSDFVGLLKIMDDYMAARRENSSNQLKKWCRAHFLNGMRMREWRDLRQQLMQIGREHGVSAKSPELDHESLHRMLLPAWLGQIGLKDDNDYLGARGRRFHIFPGSGLFKRRPRWIMTATLVETSKVYARVNATVEPEWIEQAGSHLVTRHWFEPHWLKRPGRVMGFEQVTLFGLPLVERRRVHYGALMPEEAHRVFVLDALVRDQLGVDAPFANHNRREVARIESVEERQRQQNLLLDESIREQFFLRRVPNSIHNRKAFERWRKKAEAETPRLLFYRQEDLIAETNRGFSVDPFPDHLDIDGVTYGLSYLHKPADLHDGATIRVPLERLGTLKAEALEWLIPGWLDEKVARLIKTLPKAQRKHFVPVPDWTDRFVQQSDGYQGRGLLAELAEFLSQSSSIAVDETAFDPARLEPFLTMNIRVHDGDALIDVSRDLIALRDAHAEAARSKFVEQAGNAWLRDNLTTFPEDPIPESIDLDDGATAWPALVDQETAVGLRLFESAEQAHDWHRHGLHRLLIMNLRDKVRYLQRHSGIDTSMCLHYAPIDTCEALKTDFVEAVTMRLIDRCKRPPRDRDAFRQLVDTGRQKILPMAEKWRPILAEALTMGFAIHRSLNARSFVASWPWAHQDMTGQLGYLLYPRFLTDVALEKIADYPRYLQAMQTRIDRLNADPARDADRHRRIEGFWRDYLELATSLESPPPSLEQFHWLCEEYRVSLFAQDIGTTVPVSAKRLAKAWAAVIDDVADLEH